jgi:hypothetical protein
MWKLFALALIAVLAFSRVAPAQVHSADVNIVSVQGAVTPNGFTCIAEINNQNDDDSFDTNVVMLMPLQVHIQSMSVSGGPGTCRRGTLPNSSENGYAFCQLGHLPQGPTVRRTIKVTTTPSTAGPNYPPTCSAIVFSAVGDIDKKNNYKWWP